MTSCLTHLKKNHEYLLYLQMSEIDFIMISNHLIPKTDSVVSSSSY